MRVGKPVGQVGDLVDDGFGGWVATGLFQLVEVASGGVGEGTNGGGCAADFLVEFCEPVVGFVNVGHDEGHGGVEVVEIVEGQQFGGFLPGWDVVGAIVGLIGLVTDRVDEFGHRVEVHDAVDGFGAELPILRVGEGADCFFITPVDCAQVLGGVPVIGEAVEGGGCKFPGRFIAEEQVTVVDNLHDVEGVADAAAQAWVGGDSGQVAFVAVKFLAPPGP